MAKNRHKAAAHLKVARLAAFEQVADAVGGMLRGADLVKSSPRTYKARGRECSKGRYSGATAVSRRLGRDMRRTLWVLQRGDSDATISTLADIAHATGHKIRIVIEKAA